MTCDEIIIELVKMTGCRSKAHLAEIMEVTPQTMNNWVHGKVLPQNMRQKAQLLIPRINPAWLAGESDEPMLKQESVPSPKEAPAKMFPAQLVRDFNVMCGTVDLPEQSEEMVPISVPKAGVKYVFPCSGNSMEPLIHAGDYVGVGDPMNMFSRFRDKAVYLIITRDTAMVKRLHDPGRNCEYLQLLTDNENYTLDDGGRLMKEDVRQIYEVKMIMKFNWPNK